MPAKRIVTIRVAQLLILMQSFTIFAVLRLFCLLLFAFLHLDDILPLDDVPVLLTALVHGTVLPLDALLYAPHAAVASMQGTYPSCCLEGSEPRTLLKRFLLSPEAQNLSSHNPRVLPSILYRRPHFESSTSSKFLFRQISCRNNNQYRGRGGHQRLRFSDI